MTKAEQIVCQVADKYDLGNWRALLKNERGGLSREHQHARQEAWLAIRQTLAWPYQKIGRYFGGLHHTTVMYGVRVATRRLKANGRAIDFVLTEPDALPGKTPVPVRLSKLEDELKSMRKLVTATTSDLRAALRMLDGARGELIIARREMAQFKRSEQMEVMPATKQVMSMGLRGW